MIKRLLISLYEYIQKEFLILVLEDVQEGLRQRTYGQEGNRNTADFNYGLEAAIEVVQEEIEMINEAK